MKKFNPISFPSVITLVLLMMCLPLLSSGQANFAQATYKINEQCGLKSTEAYHVMKDSKNNLWICSDMGLVRYDGFNATSFTTKNGLPSNVVFQSYEDPFGRIWALSIRKELYYIENDSIHPYIYNSLLDTLLDNDEYLFKRILIDKDSTVYFSNAFNGTFSIDKNGNYQVYSESISKFEIIEIDGKFLLSCWNKKGLVNFNIQSKNNYTHNIIDSLSLNLPSDISNLNIDPELNTLEGLILIGGKVISLPSTTILATNVTALEKIPYTTEYWISKNNYTYRAEFSNNKLIPILNSDINQNLYVSSIYADKDGNTWFSTLEEGIIYLPEYKVHHLSNASGNKIEDEVLDFCINKDQIILSFKNHILDVNSNQRYPSDHSKLVFKNNHLFISNLWRIDNHFELEKYPKNTQFVNHARDIYVDGNEFFATTSYIHRTNTVNLEYDTVLFRRDLIRFISQVARYRNELYCSSKNKLYKVINDSVELIYDFSNKEITDLLVYQDRLLISTKNFGIYQYDGRQTKHFLNKKNGLNNENVNVMAKSANNRYLYIGCFKGLEIYDHFTSKCISISKNQGLTDLKVNKLEEAEGILYIATEKGFYKISYHDIRNLSKINSSNEIHPEVTNLRVDTENYKNLISLPTDAQVLSISFQIKDLKNWFNKRYQYQINEGEWINILSPEIVLTNPQKRLKINLRYYMSNNTWSDSVVLIEGSIREPFYTSVWFFVILLFFLAFAVFLVMKGINSNKIRKLEKENEMLSYQQRMQNARMKPHFIFNVLNSIYSFILFNENKNAANYLLKFSALMRSVLENSSDEKVKISDEVKLLENYLELENLRHDNSFQYDIKIHNTDKFLEIPSLMIQPFVENAIVHGLNHDDKNSRIQVDIEKINDQIIEVKIFNTGKISAEIAEKLHQSTEKNAVGITRSRLKNYNNLNTYEQYKMEIENVYNGTLIKLFIPIL
ncbi:Histidine kinase [Lishizhenia tianjinensis]|uniref:Histidine kinase n=1 Tax=Lishizhenia tianjinensis TaxID=477690 RepID=A0A1I6YL93_9FLAO|nr:histidine kinase [Lishizhenia tianjinensis]SFT51256.1 Histidine kinase [Lishizhenia tianjinensis]